MYGESVKDFKTGDRVELHPASDTWMRGDRYGTVERALKVFVLVRMDKSERLMRCLPRDLKVMA